MMERWSEETWRLAQPVYRDILELPFVTGLAAGTLPREKFMEYLRQDALYLDNYSRVLALIASRMRRKDHLESFLRFALDGVEVERSMHEVFLGGVIPGRQAMSRACLLYTSLLSAQAMAPVEIAAAAVLPCFWVYQRVGEDIVARTGTDNPYRQWIDTYSDPAFARATDRAIEICDELAADASPEIRRGMTDIFLTCTLMEKLFWEI